MSKKILAKTEGMLREEWLALRKQGIGGSDAAAACGFSRWNSPLGLWLEKTSSDTQSVYNEAMFWGTTLESVIRDVFSTKIGKVVEVMPYIFQSEDYPFMIADIDGIIREDDGSVSLVEIKTVSAFKAGEWADGLPAEYYIQIQHYLAVCELPRAYVVYLIGGNELHYELVERDEETISTIIMLESAFWDKVMRRQKPDVDENSAEALDQLYPASNKTSIILPDEADKLLDDYMAIKAIEDDVKKQKNLLENQLKSMLGEAECAKSRNGFSVSWKEAVSTRLDTAALKKEQPDLVAKYTVRSSYRRFSVYKPKNNTDNK
ncbi:MAG: YqaJ viral recombinase family protein [Selenomonadaceae bacterium]|nr:YqaJ viral recombinase family protein [Selenomonadaceae bacterium]